VDVEREEKKEIKDAYYFHSLHKLGSAPSEENGVLPMDTRGRLRRKKKK